MASSRALSLEFTACVAPHLRASRVSWPWDGRLRPFCLTPAVGYWGLAPFWACKLLPLLNLSEVFTVKGFALGFIRS